MQKQEKKAGRSGPPLWRAGLFLLVPGTWFLAGSGLSSRARFASLRLHVVRRRRLCPFRGPPSVGASLSSSAGVHHAASHGSVFCSPSRIFFVVSCLLRCLLFHSCFSFLLVSLSCRVYEGRGPDRSNWERRRRRPGTTRPPRPIVKRSSLVEDTPGSKLETVGRAGGNQRQLCSYPLPLSLCSGLALSLFLAVDSARRLSEAEREYLSIGLRGRTARVTGLESDSRDWTNEKGSVGKYQQRRFSLEFTGQR